MRPACSLCRDNVRAAFLVGLLIGGFVIVLAYGLFR